MKDSNKRLMLRSTHILFAIPIVGYIYSPFEQLPNYAPAVRFVVIPVMLVTGLWMWKGHVLRRLISKRSADDRRRELSFGARGSRS
jgi:thiosulfate reductase cytochrome b subunit